jgi:hypothetical protein
MSLQSSARARDPEVLGHMGARTSLVCPRSPGCLEYGSPRPS